MSKSVVEERKKDMMYFHGKDIRSKKFRRNIQKKASLTHAILINTAIIIISIIIVWLFVIYGG